MGEAWDAAQEGFNDAAGGEPLFPDADPHYALGWCNFHGCENPFADFVSVAPGENSGATANG